MRFLVEHNDSVVTRKVAAGEAPVPGADGHIGYPLNYHGRPFHELAQLTPKSQRLNCKVVHARDELAILHPPTAAVKGTSVSGDSLEAKGNLVIKSPSLEEIAGDHTIVEEKSVLAGCDGLCEEEDGARSQEI